MASWYCCDGHSIRATWARSPGAVYLPTRPPRTLTMRSCMRAFRWSPLALAWAAAMWYRSIRCSSASRRVRGGGGTSGADRGGGRQRGHVKSLGKERLSCPGLPATQGSRSLPGVEGTVVGVGGCGGGDGGSGGSWSEGREVQSMRGLLGHPPTPGWCGLRGFPGGQ